MTRFLPTRRSFFAFAAAAGCAASLPRLASASPAPSDVLVDLEARSGGRLGACFIQGGRITGHRLEERFALCSSFKLALAALALREREVGRLDFDQRIAYGEADLLGWSPVTRARAKEGSMRVGDLAQAAQEQSDNTAANLLLKRLGGPQVYNAFLREIGDQATRLDDLEPYVGYAAADGIGNTTTPAAMARTVLTLTEAGPLSPRGQRTLLGWMRAAATGPRRLKAGLPASWRLGHKTGTQAGSDKPNICVDIGVAFPPGRAPLAIAVYYEGMRASPETRAEDEAVVAEVGRIAAAWTLEQR